MQTVREYFIFILSIDPIYNASIFSFIIVSIMKIYVAYFKEAKGQPFKERIKTVAVQLSIFISYLFLLIIVSVTFFFFLNLITSRWSSIISIVDTPYAIPVCFVIACTLFKLKTKNPALYGALELLFAASVIYYATQKPEEDTAVKSTAIFGGIYVLVRGLDNINRDIPDFLKRVWKWIT